MKLHASTIDNIKIFAAINPSISFKSDMKEIRVRSPKGNVMATSIIEDSFPVDFSIYDCHSFISAIQLLGDEAELDFSLSDKSVSISSPDGASATYVFSSPVLVPYVEKLPKDDKISADIEFTMSSAQLKLLFKSTASLSLTNIVFEGSEGKLKAKASSVSSASSNEFSIDLGAIEQLEDFKMIFNIEYFQIDPASGEEFNFLISKSGIAKIWNETMTYYITTQDTSSFGAPDAV